MAPYPGENLAGQVPGDGLQPFAPEGLSTTPPALTPLPPLPPLEAKLSKEEARVIKRRLQIAEEYAKKEFAKPAKRALKLWLGEHYPNMERRSEKARVVVNYILPMVQTMLASTAFREPQFWLEPQSPQGQANESVARNALRYEWQQAKAMRECRRALWDQLVTSVGIVFTGWLFETEEGQVREDGRPPVVGEPLDTTADAMAADPAIAPDEVREDRFLARRINPERFLIAPECDSELSSAAYCGYWEWRPLEEVKADKRFRGTRKLVGSNKSLKGYYPEEMRALLEGPAEKPAEEAEKDCLRVKLYHYYERRRKLHVVMCDEHDEPLMVRKWNWQADRYPFRTIQGPTTNDSFYGLPLPVLVEHPQQEINESRTQLSVHRKLSNPWYQAVGFTLDEGQRNTLASGAPNRVVENLPHELEAGPQTQLPQEAFEAENRALSAFQMIAGLNEYQTATPPSKRMTSTEVEAVQSGMGARAADAQQQFEELVAGVGEDCLAWLQQYSVRTRTLPIYDDQDRVQEFVDMTPAEIKGRFLVHVYAGSTAVSKEQEQVKNIGFLLQSLTPYVQTGQVNPRPLLAQLLKAVPGIKNVDEILPEPQPMAQLPGGLPGMPTPAGGAPQAPGAPAGDPLQQLAMMRAAAGTEMDGMPPELMAMMNGGL